MLCGMEGEAKGQAQRPGDRWGVGLQTQTKEAGAGRLLSTGWGSQGSVSPGEPAPPPAPGGPWSLCLSACPISRPWSLVADRVYSPRDTIEVSLRPLA